MPYHELRLIQSENHPYQNHRKLKLHEYLKKLHRIILSNSVDDQDDPVKLTRKESHRAVTFLTPVFYK